MPPQPILVTDLFDEVNGHIVALLRSLGPEDWHRPTACSLWDVKDLAEAVAWVKRCPNPMPGPSEIEIRPLYEAADFQ